MTEKRFILSYDLTGAKDSDHADFKLELQTHGWDACISTKKGRKKLPETTMVGKFSDQETAKNTVTTSATAKSIKIGRYLVVEIPDLGISGKFEDDCED